MLTRLDSCDTRVRAYKDGKTFDECKAAAVVASREIGGTIRARGSMSWAEILGAVNYDALVFKLTLKYLRQDGFDIGNNKSPEVGSVP